MLPGKISRKQGQRLGDGQPTLAADASGERFPSRNSIVRRWSGDPALVVVRYSSGPTWFGGANARDGARLQVMGRSVTARRTRGAVRRAIQHRTVTRRKVAGMEVDSLLGLLFWLLKSASRSPCSSSARPFFSAAAKAFMVGP